MSKSDVKAGGAFVRLFLKDELTRNLRKSMDTAGKNMAIAGAAITGVLAAGVKHFANYGDQLDKMSKRTNVAASELARLKFAAEQSGTGIEAIERAMREMQTKGMDPSDFRETAAAIAAIEDPTERAQKAMDTFGRRIGTQLLPMLKDIDKHAKEADMRGIVPSEEDIAKAAELTDSFNRMKQVVGSAFFNVGAALADDIEIAIAKVVEIAQGTASWIRENKELIITVGSMGVVLLTTGSALVVLAKSIGIATVAMSFMVAHPIIAGLAAIAAGVALVQIALWRARAAAQAKLQALRDLTAEGAKQHTDAKAMRSEDQERMKRLETLYALQQRFGALTEEQTAEAAGLVTTLTDRYGDLGISLDGTTGKLQGVNGAMGQMVDIMRDMAAIELDNQIRTLQKELAAIEKQADEFASRGGWTMMFGGTAGTTAELEGVAQQHREATQEIIALTEARRRLAGGDMGSVTGDQTGSGVTGDEQAALDSLEARERFEERLNERILQMKLRRITDEEKSELASLDVRYQQEREELLRLEGTEEELAKLRMIWERERFDARQRFAQRRAEQDKRDLEENARIERQTREEIARMGLDFEDRIARQRIELETRDDPEARRKKMIEYEHQLEMKRIAAKEGITEEEKRNLEMQAKTLRDLQVAGGAAVAGEQAGQATSRGMSSVTGMFRAAAIAAAGRGVSPEEKQLHELRAIRKEAREQKDATRRLEQFVQRAGAGLAHG